MRTVGRRLAQVRTQQNSSQTAMAQKLGIAQSTLSQIEQGHSSISADVLARLLTEFNINSNWMLTGDGPMHAPAHQQSSDIPLVGAGAEAGYLQSKGSRDFISTLKRYSLPGFEGDRDLLIFTVDGDSMIPTFSPGDYVVCEHLEEIPSLHEGSLAVVVTDTGIVVKRISYFDSDEGALILRSDNATYKPQMLALSEVREVWLVRARLTITLDHAILLTNQKVLKLEQELTDMREQLSELKRLMETVKRHTAS